MEKIDKIIYFEYVIYKLLKWHEELNGSDLNDFSSLKLMGLLFFVTAADANYNTESVLVNHVFDNFVAMPYGHIEQDIRESLIKKRGQLDHYFIDNSITKGNCKSFILKNVFKEAIDNSIDYLKKYSPKIITAFQFELVNLSHVYYSWQHFMEIAKKEGRFSYPIPKEFIQKEDKIFSLALF